MNDYTLIPVDGPCLLMDADLPSLKALKLEKSEVLADSYLWLDYDVIQETVIDPL